MVCKEKNVVIDKKKNRKSPNVHNVLEAGTIPPDGGWGWVVVAATGFSMVLAVSLIICFGLLFRDGLKQLDINAFQTSTLISINGAVAAFLGLTNGPLFRKFSYRQAACAGGFVCSISIIALAFVKTYYSFLFFFSIMYASGKSILLSANSLALITYFKEKRQTAVGLSWACSGIGSILVPQIAAVLMSIYGMSGTTLVLGGFVLNTIVLGLLLQPVRMHAKKDTGYKSIATVAEAENIKEDDEDTSGTVTNQTGKMLSMANTIQWDKLANLVEKRSSRTFGSQRLHNNDNQKDWRTSEVDDLKRKTASDPNPTIQDVVTKLSGQAGDDENHETKDYGSLDKNDETTENLLGKGLTVSYQKVEQPEENKIALCTHAYRRLIVTFDLDLLRDCVYINLMVGVSFTMFAEVNFIFLTPYVLLDFGLNRSEVATVISVLSGVDVLTRFAVSFVATRIGWSNRTLMLIGVGSSALGRVALAHVSAYSAILAAVVFSGIGKALIMVFTSLVLADHVSLEKLASAHGLQLMFKGIVFLALGPIIGRIKDIYGDNTAMLYFLNVFNLLVIVSWILEDWCCSWKRRRQQRTKDLRV